MVNGDSMACVLSSLGLSRGGVWSAGVLCEPSFLECLLEGLERAGYAGDARISRISPPGTVRAFVALERRRGGRPRPRPCPSSYTPFDLIIV